MVQPGRWAMTCHVAILPSLLPFRSVVMMRELMPAIFASWATVTPRYSMTPLSIAPEVPFFITEIGATSRMSPPITRRVGQDRRSERHCPKTGFAFIGLAP